MSWEIAAIANAVVGVAYLAISAAIIGPLIRSGQVRENRLGVATALIFFTCAVHHGSHSLHMVLPAFGVDEQTGSAMREAFQWQTALWDVLTAVVGVYYWTLRRSYGSLMQGAKLFEDMHERQRQALEINDNIVQGLTVAYMSLELGEREKSQEALANTLAASRNIISSLLGDVQESSARLHAGGFVRTTAANIGAVTEESDTQD